MSKLTDVDIKTMKDGDNNVESLGRCNGAMVFRRVGNTCTCFYRYWQGKQSILIKLDAYQQTPKSPGLKLSQLRDKALAMVALRKQVAPIGLKEYLRNLDAELKLKLKNEEQEKVKELNKGSLQDLLDCYVEYLQEREAPSLRHVIPAIKRNISLPYPELLKKKAADITPDDLMPALSRIIKRDTPVMYNNVRAILSAAFNRGMKLDYSPRQHAKQGKRFNIRSNPVALYPVEPTNPKKRRLNHEELRALWLDIDSGKFTKNYQYGLFVQFCLACFGNRPTQLASVTWADIDIEKHELTFVDKKRKIPVSTTIPLTRTALQIIDKMICFRDSVMISTNPESLPVFLTKELTPLNMDTLSAYIKRYNNAFDIEGSEKEPWTMRALRKTANTIMTNAGIIEERRYLLQSRAFDSVEEKHYSDRRMKEKWESGKKYESLLTQIIEGSDPEDLSTLPEVVCNAEFLGSYEVFKDEVIKNNEIKSKNEYRRKGYTKQVINLWFNQLETEGIIKKVGNCLLYRLCTDSTEGLADCYETFKNRIIRNHEIKTYRLYEKDGYGQRTLKNWFTRLEQEGIVKRTGYGFRLIKDVTPEMEVSYEDFKLRVLTESQLKIQLDYVAEGYAHSKVRLWYKQLQTEGHITKNGQGYILNGGSHHAQTQA